MNSMFERLGALIKEKLESDEQDIFKNSTKTADSESTEDEAFSTEAENASDSEKFASTGNVDSKKTSESHSQNAQSFYSKPKQKNSESTHTRQQQERPKTYSFKTNTSKNRQNQQNYTIYKAQRITKPIPVSVQKDFDFLALPYTATLEQCKVRYKKLIKAYHPDRYSGDEIKQKNATEHTAKINAAFNNITQWIKSQ